MPRPTLPPSADAGDDTNSDTEHNTQPADTKKSPRPAEVGGPKGLEPTRYGDWERNGRCSDF